MAASFDCAIRKEGPLTVLSLSGSLDASASERFERELAKVGDREGVLLLVRATDLQFMGSAGWGALLNLSRKLARREGKLALCGLSGPALSSHRNLNVGRLLPHFEDAHAARGFLVGQRDRPEAGEPAAGPESPERESPFVLRMRMLELRMKFLSGRDWTVEEERHILSELERIAVTLERLAPGGTEADVPPVTVPDPPRVGGADHAGVVRVAAPGTAGRSLEIPVRFVVLSLPPAIGPRRRRRGTVAGTKEGTVQALRAEGLVMSSALLLFADSELRVEILDRGKRNVLARVRCKVLWSEREAGDTVASELAYVDPPFLRPEVLLAGSAPER